ncbi:WD40/YVTN/BNR-like repeat-containing protein [Cognaticolwellia aestuarii]|uniref:WD40/YVTN/BNR-like repeat-containing protein n=1 Tax=Cognaticolwellia aestuarii TaxID=329993 RepID=UPI000984B160|nr:YCF48-related protein [Cognaticolwellia aestuarii]
MRLLVILLSFLTIPIINAQPLDARLAPLASKSLLLDIIEVNQSKLVAVGERGHILLSSDGADWQQAQVPVQVTLTAVYFIDEMHGWAVGHDATILSSSDGGVSWQIQQHLPEMEKPLLDVLFFDKNTGVAVGAYGLFYRTNDGGQHWSIEYHNEFLYPEDQAYLAELKREDEVAYLDEQSSILPHFNRVVADEGTLYLAGELGLIAKSNDLGVSWQRLDEIYPGSFYDIKRTQADNLVVIGLRGHVFRSLENGSSWQASDSHVTALLSSIVLSDDQRVFILGNNGVLLESRDDGVSFTKHLQKDGKALIAGVWYKNKIIAVSDVGIKTINITK